MRVGTALALATVAQVRALRAELELVRVRLGRPEDERPVLDVRETAPREVYFQARALETRSRRLSFELTRRHHPAPEARPADELTPADVTGVVRAARAQIELLLEGLDIEERVPETTPDPAHAPTDVDRAIVGANRQLDLLTSEA